MVDLMDWQMECSMERSSDLMKDNQMVIWMEHLMAMSKEL